MGEHVNKATNPDGSPRPTLGPDTYVADTAWVFGNAWVSGDAKVYGSAKVYGNAWVSGDAKVYGSKSICWGVREHTWTWYRTTEGSDLFFGCERHPLDEWTADLIRELVAKHNDGTSVSELEALVTYLTALTKEKTDEE